jgi:hypothetical protein
MAMPMAAHDAPINSSKLGSRFGNLSASSDTAMSRLALDAQLSSRVISVALV